MPQWAAGCPFPRRGEDVAFFSSMEEPSSEGRLEGAAPGQLSIASGDGGAVSLASTPGALSHAKKTDA